MKRVGFTGTRNGMTDQQRFAFSNLIFAIHPEEFHHGAAVGADAMASLTVDSCDWCRVVAHPGVSAYGGLNRDRDQASINRADEVRPEAAHFERNRQIVKECDPIIAIFPCRPMPDKGGTRYTFDQAIKAGKTVFAIWPDGDITTHLGPE